MKQLETVLTDRVLRYDGISIIDPEKLVAKILSGITLSKIRVTELTQEVNIFNSQVTDEDKIKLSENDAVNLSFKWNLPIKYINLNIENFILEKFQEFSKEFTETELELASKRVLDELDEIDARGLTELFKTIIFVIDKFKEDKIVWGVGRGSSCASYILFILGLHLVDCLKYDIPFEEFFHD